MVFESVVIIIVANYLRRSLKTSVTMPEWNKKLLWIMYAAIALIILEIFISKLNPVTQLLSIGLLAALLYIIYSNEKFITARFLVTAIGPFVIVSFIDVVVRLISISFYNEWNNWFDAASTFAVIWGIGTWLVTRKQQKELLKAREKAHEQEQNNKVITAMKAELEIQVAERTAELTKQKEELELALEELKSTQAQLIQSEKMASLGELTAGIAHEIQNPLNFVNNFSEVNTELIDELKSEKLKSANLRDENLENQILNDITQNLEKISFHGRRADAIVKGMLQHSRKNTGQKEPTDINALADEYLRLSYHGLRAKDKSFNATMNTDFDKTIEKTELVSQDIGRVLLNLFNNAFYAVNERQKAESLKTNDGYKPTVSVQTKKLQDEIEIQVADNGNGIPQHIIDKIFQPFFTTKPTGEGTGLGLSLSYDIITKEHNGTITAKANEGEGTVIVIQLPVN